MPGRNGEAVGHLSAGIYLVPLVAYWLVLIYNLGAQWAAYEQYNYGWAVPVLCGYLIWRRGKELMVDGGERGKAESRKQKAEISQLHSHFAPHTSYLPSPISCLVALGLLLALYAPTRLLHEANPIWRLTSWSWSLELIGITLVVVRLALGPKRLKQLAFPIGFFLVAVPWPSGPENFLTQSLMQVNASATVEVLGVFGIPAFQHGNVIEVATGVVGIDEACSGIRSLQATLMVALFFGELYGLRAWRRVVCVAAGFGLAFVFNAGRTTLLSWVAAKQGIGAIARWHDPAGVVILVGCFVCLWAVARGMTGAKKGLMVRELIVDGGEVSKAEDGKVESRKQEAEIGNRQSLAINHQLPNHQLPTYQLPNYRLLLSLGLGVWFVVVEGGTEIWFRAHEKPADSVDWSIKWPRQNGTFQSVELSPSVRSMLRFDQGESGRWQAADGSSWQVFFLRWLPARSVYGRVRVSLTKSHNPEVCLQAAGMKLRAEREPLTVQTEAVGPINFRRYIFDAEGRTVHVFFSVAESMNVRGSPGFLRMNHWDRVKAALAGSRNYGQRTLEVAVEGVEQAGVADEAVKRWVGDSVKR